MNRVPLLPGEAARHPFRGALPPHVTQGDGELRPAPSSDKDWKLFLLSFAAFFTVFYSFIA